MLSRKSQKRNNPIELDVYFTDTLSDTDLTHIVIEQLKLLLFQKRQIPVPLDQLRSDVISHDQSKCIKTEAIDDESRTDNFPSSHKFHQDKRRRIRDCRLKEKYIQRSNRFLKVFDELEHRMKNVLSLIGGCELLSVCFIFGTSPISPRETYRLQFPKGYTRKATSVVNRKVIMQLFRTISADDDLFSRLGEHVGQTNIFIAFERNSNKIISDILPHYLTNKPGFKYPPTNNRCKLTSFILSHNMEHSLVRDTPAKTRKLSENRHIFNTPQPMQLCTPIITKSKIDHPPRNFVISQYPNFEMEETPCAKTKKQSCSLNTSNFHSAKRNSSIAVADTDEKAKELDYLVFEDEKIFRRKNTDLPKDFLSKETRMHIEPPSQWLFIDHILQGFNDPQRYN